MQLRIQEQLPFWQDRRVRVALSDGRTHAHEFRPTCITHRVDYRLNCKRQCVDRIWIEKLRGVGIYLAVNRYIRRYDGAATFHGFDSRKVESFSETWTYRSAGVCVQDAQFRG